MRNNPAQTAQLSPAAARWLTSALGAIVALHALNLPLWILALFACAAAWRWHMAANPRAAPPRWVLAPLTVLVAASVFVYGGTVFGREAGVALLAAMSALKLLEARSVRDGAVLTSLGLLLLMAVLLYSEDLLTAAGVLAALAVLLAAQLAVHTRTALLAPMQSLRLTGRMLLQALPVMLVMFILFPRIPGPLWALPRDAHSARSGLSERMEPGSISELIQSSEVALRVRFSGAPPRQSQMYWRGPVLSRLDERAWTTGPERAQLNLPYEVSGGRIDYSVTLEPHTLRSLFALDLPGMLPSESAITQSYELKRARPIAERTQYAMTSFLEYRTPPLSDAERARQLELPTRGNARARALAAEWRAQHQSDAAIVQAALRLFRTQSFFYTLRPPLLGENNVDEFLFNTRRGFCEHYAGSFVFLMRAAGVPARVVTGYQGGEANGDYYIVRQSDAHAWAEVWLAPQGWTRVDPTAAVAPQRVEQGLYAAADDAAELPLLTRRSASLWRSAALLWDRANNAWNQWVLGYGPERQKQFLSGLGFGRIEWQQMVLAMTVLLAAFFGGAMLYAHLRNRRKIDPVARAYQKLCDTLARKGLPRAPHEGPLDYTRRVAGMRPELRTQLDAIGTLYASLRYAARANADPRELLKLIATLKV